MPSVIDPYSLIAQRTLKESTGTEAGMQTTKISGLKWYSARRFDLMQRCAKEFRLQICDAQTPALG